MKKKADSKTSVRYRDAGTGQFITKQKANRRSPNTVIRERVPKSGYGDIKR